MSINLLNKDNKIINKSNLFQIPAYKDKFVETLFDGKEAMGLKLQLPNILGVNLNIEDRKNKVIYQLQEELLKPIQKKEREFYEAIGVSDFSQFVKKWKSTSDGNDADKIIDITLSLFTGQNIRRATTNTNSIANILKNLILISIDGDFTEEEHETIVQKLINKQIIVKKNKKNWYELSENNMDLNSVIENINKIISEEFHSDNLLKIEDMFYNQEKTTVQQTLSKNFFFFFSFGNIKLFKTYKSKLLDLLLEYIKISIGKNKYDEWDKNIIEKLKHFYENLLTDYFKAAGDKITERELLNSDQLLMGFFGELYTHGKFLHIRTTEDNLNFKIYNTGSLYGEETNQQLSYDTLIVTADNKKYGIQTKNPYTTYEGTYTTYQQSMSLSSEALFKRYLTDSVGTINPDIRDIIQLFAINSNQDETGNVSKQLENFIFYFSNNFIRIFNESIREKEVSNKIGEELRADLLNGNAINIFFVVQGHLIPSSLILEQLINQYEKNIDIKTTQDYVFYYNLKNNNAVNNSRFIFEDSEIKNILNNIKLITKLKTPPIKIKET